MGAIGPGFGHGRQDMPALFRYIAYVFRQNEANVDIIYLHDLKIDCVIGIWDWERRIKQRIIIDLDMACDIRRAAASDHIDDTLNYKAVAKRLLSYVGESEFRLVETLAENVARVVREEFHVPWVRVRVNKKGAVRGASDVGIIIERGDKMTASDA